jgi:N-acetylmuramoyl-L-alanine amidase
MRTRIPCLAGPSGPLALAAAATIAISAALAQEPGDGRKPAHAPGPLAKKVAKPKVIKMASPNKGGRDGAKIDAIVLHHTVSGGTAEDTGRRFQDPKAEVSSHYIVDKEGTIVQSVEDKDRAWHAGKSVFKGREDVNDFSIGIEMVNKGDGKDPFTDEQYEALGKLVAFLQSEYDIPRDRITGHKDIALPKGRKVDPADNFSYERLFEEVEKTRGAAPGRKP